MKFSKQGSGLGRRGLRRGLPAGQGVDPDVFFSDASGGKPDYHTRALCKQVQRTLSVALSGECGDPLLQDLLVLAVLPAPNAGHLLVVVAPRSVDGTMADFLERLGRIAPLLRSRIAQDTARKRTPELSFDVLGKGVLGLEVPEACDGPEEFDGREGRP